MTVVVLVYLVTPSPTIVTPALLFVTPAKAGVHLVPSAKPKAHAPDPGQKPGERP
jgi:hypothetical protein